MLGTEHVNNENAGTEI